MKITIEFEDLEEAQVYLDAYKYYSSLYEFKEHIRNKLKYDDTLTDEEYNITEEISNLFHDILKDNNISM